MFYYISAFSIDVPHINTPSAEQSELILVVPIFHATA